MSSCCHSQQWDLSVPFGAVSLPLVNPSLPFLPTHRLLLASPAGPPALQRAPRGTGVCVLGPRERSFCLWIFTGARTQEHWALPVSQKSSCWGRARWISSRALGFSTAPHPPGPRLPEGGEHGRPRTTAHEGGGDADCRGTGFVGGVAGHGRARLQCGLRARTRAAVWQQSWRWVLMAGSTA